MPRTAIRYSLRSFPTVVSGVNDSGVTQALAYALTGNIWLASGLHAGANVASFIPTGLWHAGAVIALVGQVPIPNWFMAILTLVALGTVVILKSPSVTMDKESLGTSNQKNTDTFKVNTLVR